MARPRKHARPGMDDKNLEEIRVIDTTFSEARAWAARNDIVFQDPRKVAVVNRRRLDLGLPQFRLSANYFAACLGA